MPTKLSRRGFLAATGTSPLVAGKLSASVSEALGVEGLLVDGLDAPLGLHSPAPRLSWRLTSHRRDVEQREYRIGVSSSAEKAARGDFDLWDSGRVESKQCFDIAYAGKSLASRTRCHWRVTIWDRAGRTATSAVSTWEMGLLSPQDWQAQWIAAETAEIRADRTAGFAWRSTNQSAREAGAASFRLSFTLPEAMTCTLYTIASQTPDMMLDGKSVDLPPFDPNTFGPRAADRTVMRLGKGRHVLALHVPMEKKADGLAGLPRVAVLIRGKASSGTVLHVTGDGMLTAAGKPPRWADAGQEDRNWQEAALLPDAGQAPFPGNGAFLMRRPFKAAGPLKSARLFVTALGAYVPMINGQRVGDARLAPEWTDFRRHVLYRAYDVTSFVQDGANMLGAVIGDGWYGSYNAPGGRYTFGGPPLRLKAQLELEYQDGRRDIVGSDDQWSLSPSHIVESEIYHGEDVDGRLEQPGWSTTAFTPDARWEGALPIDTPPIVTLGSALPPIRVTGKRQAETIRSIAPGSAVIDFGQNFAGWVRIRLRGEAGRKVTLRFAELLKPDGSVDQSNLRGARAADTYILRGDAQGETFEPEFTYHGFRYVQVDGLPAPLTSADIEGLIVHTDLPETGTLTLGQHVPQRLWQNGLWSQRSNFVGIPTDCPQRDERLGWMGDAHVFWDAASFNMDTASFTRKFMRDVRDTQRDDGSFPDFAPDAAHGTFAFPGSSPGWSDAGVLLPWTSWRRYGETALIDEHWSAMERYLASVEQSNPDLVWRNRRGFDYGDWLALDAKQPGDPTSPKDLVGTAMWKSSVDAIAQMAAATGRTTEAKRYTALADGITKAFATAFVRADGTIGNGSQTSYILALRFNLVPPMLRAAAAKKLVADIERRGKLLSTGFLGTPFSLDVLADMGHHGLVYDLLLRTAYPSWGYMIAKNATTIWERWNGDVGDVAMNSFNHYALGAVAGFMYRRIAGIDPVTPGFEHFRFDPVYDDRMPKAAGQYESRSGLIATAWERSLNRFTLDIKVPPNSRCTLRLPTDQIGSVSEQGRPVTDRWVKQADKGAKLELELGSGGYRFEVANAAFDLGSQEAASRRGME